MNATLEEDRVDAPQEPRTAAADRAPQTGSILLDEEPVGTQENGGGGRPPTPPPRRRRRGGGEGGGVPRWQLLLWWGVLILLSFFAGWAASRLRLPVPQLPAQEAGGG